MSGKTALVTGSSGFLGVHLVHELVSQGYFVRQLDLVKPKTVSAQSEFIACDIRDAQEVLDASQGIDLVFHCAAISDIDQCLRNPQTAIEINVLGTLNVLKAVAEGGGKRFMLASSLYALSSKGSIYKTTKIAAENLVLDFAEGAGLNYTILRFGSLYGPGAKKDNAIRRMLEQALMSQRIDYWGTGEEVREYIHIRDAARLAVAATEAKFEGQAIHVSGPEKIRTSELLAMINEILGGTIEVRYSDAEITGRYSMTPYSYKNAKALGQKIQGETYTDLGAGLMEAIKLVVDESGLERP